MLTDKFEEPNGFHWGEFPNLKGAKIRYGSLQPEGVPKGTMVIVTGFRETIEKYFEVAQEMTAKGLAVWIMDWRGQGGSERHFTDNPQKMYSDGYDEQIETLHQFATQVVKKSAGPLILSAHSMGAHIALRHMKEHPGVFDSAILASPMIDIYTGVLPKPLARQITRFAKAGDYLSKYSPGGGDWTTAREQFNGNPLTSDRGRFDANVKIFRDKPQLKMGDPTYGWAYHTFKSIDILNDEKYLKSIQTPILMGIAGDDAVVDTAASERAARLLPHCTKVNLPAAKHEIWMESDQLRNPWLKKVDAFLEERLKPRAPAPKKPDQNKLFRPPKAG